MAAGSWYLLLSKPCLVNAKLAKFASLISPCSTFLAKFALATSLRQDRRWIASIVSRKFFARWYRENHAKSRNVLSRCINDAKKSVPRGRTQSNGNRNRDRETDREKEREREREQACQPEDCHQYRVIDFAMRFVPRRSCFLAIVLHIDVLGPSSIMHNIADIHTDNRSRGLSLRYE